MAERAPGPSREDLHAVEQLSRKFRPALMRYFARRGFPPLDAEDAVQDVFARLSRREGLAAIERLDAYLFETAASVAIDQVRKGVVRHVRAHDSYDESVHAIADLSAERVHEGREDLRLLKAGLRELPERTRNVFILSRLEQMKHAEIASRVGVSVSAVEKHLVKAIAYLSQRVGRGQ